MDIRIRLGDYLDEHDITPYRLAAQAEGKAAKGTIYSLSRGDVKRLDLATLSTVIAALEELTGKSVEITDLLEKVQPREAGMSAAGVPYTGDPETDAVLDDHPDILERIKRVETGKEGSRPLSEVMAELGL